jgi:hypothetical protein
MITPNSVIQSAPRGQWPNSPIVPMTSFSNRVGHRQKQYKFYYLSLFSKLSRQIVEKAWNLLRTLEFFGGKVKTLTSSKTQEHNGIEEQDEKIASASSLARNGSYLSAIRLGNLVCRSVGIKPGLISPCQNVTNNVLDAHSSYNAQIVSNSPGVFLTHTLSIVV